MPICLPACMFVFLLASNAGKFTVKGTVSVEVIVTTKRTPAAEEAVASSSRTGRGRIGPAMALQQFAVITVSNPRTGRPLGDTEPLFVPFRDQVEQHGGAAAGAGESVGSAVVCVCVGGGGGLLAVVSSCCVKLIAPGSYQQVAWD
jgi:hypothetical protein